MGTHIGELAALGTAVSWMGSALSFQESGRRIGSLTLNLIRLLCALVMLSLIGLVTRGALMPMDADPHAWRWLTLSGLVGFVLGDMCLFRAFVILGARLSSLIMSLTPLFTALFGWLVLRESLDVMDSLGMALTVVGVAMAVTERAGPATQPEAHAGRGVLLAIGGALGQAGGLVMSKYGMGSMSAIAATQIRVLAGVGGFAALFCVIGWWPRVWAARRSPAGIGYATLGAVFGPVIGVSLSLYAVQHAPAGVAASIMATTPVIIIPVTYLLYRERVTARGVLGAITAIVGVALLFL